MKQMIWSSYDLLDETAKEEYQNSQREILDDDSYEVSDEEWAEEVYCRKHSINSPFHSKNVILLL